MFLFLIVVCLITDLAMSLNITECISESQVSYGSYLGEEVSNYAQLAGLSSFTESHVLKQVRRCESSATEDMLGVQFYLESTVDESQIILDMIGEETTKCYTEEVTSKVVEVKVGYSSSNGVQRISYITDDGQVSAGSQD